MYNFKQILLTTALCLLSSVAFSMPFSSDSSIAFGLAPNASWAPTGGSGTADATGIQFNAASGLTGMFASLNGYDAFVSDANGSYTGTVGSATDFKNFTFNPLTSPTTLWSFTSGSTNYWFDMTRITHLGQTNNSIALEGVGRGYIDGYSPAGYFGNWSLTVNNNKGAFSFSSSAAIPEPSIALLLGAGLIGFGVTRKLRKKA